MKKLLSARLGLCSCVLSGPADAGDLVFTSTTFPFTTGIAAADFDGDGDVDLAVGNRFTGAATNNRLAIWANDGSGAMAIVAMLPLPSQPTDVAAGDLDHDGHPDLVVGDFVPGNRLSFFLNDGSGGFGPRVDKSVLAIPTALALGDLDGDGDLDLATSNQGLGGTRRSRCCSTRPRSARPTWASGARGSPAWRSAAGTCPRATTPP